MCYNVVMIKKKKVVLAQTPDTYPMRINKYLAHKGVATRTGVDDLIKHQKILINGNVARLGDKVLETDKVVVRGTHTKKQYRYFVYNKPRGLVSTNPQNEEKSIMQSIKLETSVFPVGRLDKDSHGLIILTNDGRITDRLLNPIYNHEKEYVVEVDRKFTPAFLKHMQEGVDIGECITKPTIAKKINETTFSIVLTEGKNTQIRRMTEKLGYTVRDLQRVRVQNIELADTKASDHREILSDELQVFLKSMNL